MSANIPDEIPSSLPDAEFLYRGLLSQLKSALIVEPKLEIAGLASGGAWLAKRLAFDLGLEHFGVINVSFHREFPVCRARLSFHRRTDAGGIGTHYSVAGD